MLSAACPSCGAPVRFAHAVAVATICAACRSTVVRTDRDVLQSAGRASVFPRDLSPILIGSHGRFAGRQFVVVGVVRKARERVRWNEWFCVFDDGKSGWLGEGNGQLQMYDAFTELPGAPTQFSGGQAIKLRGVVWQVIESDTAVVAAADGELPFAATDDAPAAYADLRLGDGRSVGTLDAAFDPPRLYTGRLVTLKELGLDPIRPFTGWSDPDLAAAMTGPELTGTRALKCPSCAAPLVLRSPEALSLVCGHCGSVVRVDDQVPGAFVSGGRGAAKWAPAIALGARGVLDGHPWEVIGIMERFVRFEGEKFSWTEYFLFNPYHGYRWLAEDHGTNQWTLIERLPDLPRRPSSRLALHAGHNYRAFQRGTANVERVVGEFTWEVRAGDTAETVDFVDPPYMLSVESEGGEQSASLGKWLPADEVGAAFAFTPERPRGTAPHQPNPFDAKGTTTLFAVGSIAFSAATVLLFVGQLAWSASEPLLTWDTALSSDGTSAIAVSAPFVVADTLRRNLWVKLDTSLEPEKAEMHLTVLNRDDGRAYHVTTGRTSGSGRTGSVSPGTYVVVAEGATDTAGTLLSRKLHVEVVRDKPTFFPVLAGFLVVLLGPVWWYAGRTLFESARWKNSDF